jgi:hypothetical protein
VRWGIHEAFADGGDGGRLLQFAQWEEIPLRPLLTVAQLFDGKTVEYPFENVTYRKGERDGPAPTENLEANRSISIIPLKPR